MQPFAFYLYASSFHAVYVKIRRMKRVIIFIDGNNFYKCAETSGKKTNLLDYYDLSKELVGLDRELIRTYYYTAPVVNDSPQAEKLAKGQQRFFTKLHHTPYLELKLGRMDKKGTNYVQKGVDVAIAIDILYMASKNMYDVAVLLSADSDLVGAVQKAKDFGKQVELGIFSSAKASHLIKACDKIVTLDALVDKLLKP